MSLWGFWFGARTYFEVDWPNLSSLRNPLSLSHTQTGVMLLSSVFPINAIMACMIRSYLSLVSFVLTRLTRDFIDLNFFFIIYAPITVYSFQESVIIFQQSFFSYLSRFVFKTKANKHPLYCLHVLTGAIFIPNIKIKTMLWF